MKGHPHGSQSHSMLSLIMCIQYTSSSMPFLFNATQAISLTMTIYSWLWVGKILSPEGCYHILTDGLIYRLTISSFPERADKIPICISGDCEIGYPLSILDIQPDKHQHLFLRTDFMGNNSRLISQPFNIDITVFSSYNHKKQVESLALLLYQADIPLIILLLN
ncbi:hypothetical protein BDB01DRAFT_216964 [Pilobolus umbonatus]|nr:hypothetical protein BDB01DRAFT_216964 [Pilobolus umbonatus]